MGDGWVFTLPASFWRGRLTLCLCPHPRLREGFTSDSEGEAVGPAACNVRLLAIHYYLISWGFKPD